MPHRGLLPFRRRDCHDEAALRNKGLPELLALTLATLCVVLHLWADAAPQRGGGLGAGGAVGRALLQAVQGLEGRATDLKFRLRGERTPHPDVVVAAVDEAGVQRYGRWPWPRDVIARALGALVDGGAAAVGLDIVFTDEAPNAMAVAYREALTELTRVAGDTDVLAHPALQRYQELLRERVGRTPDAALAAFLQSSPQVVQGVMAYGDREEEQFRTREAEFSELLTPHVLTRFPGAIPGSVYEVPWERIGGAPYRSAQTPLRVFAASGQHWGHFNVVPDVDGTLRRLPLFVKLSHPAGLLPSLELETAATALGAEIAPVWDPQMGRLRAAQLRRGGKQLREVPLELAGLVTLIDFPGGAHVFPTLSLGDLVEGRVPAEKLRGKTVLAGVTLLGEYDQVVTPFSAQEPGIYTHAALLSNILEGRFLTRPPWLKVLEAAFILAAAFLLARFLPHVRFLAKAMLVLGLVGGYLVVDQALFVRGLQLATVIPVGGTLAGAVALLFVSYLSVDREKGRLRIAFSHYLSPAVMDQMLAHPERLKLGGEKREMTVLFSDIRGFTSLSERMLPEALVRFINSYLNPMTSIVLEGGGTLDKYIGDAVMAFWGAPVDQADHALRACRAGLRFLQKLEELRARWRAENLPDFDIGVGINSGPMVVGNMGSDLRFDYTVMGDAVNLASRLEGANKEYGTRILLSEATYTLVSGEVVARRLGEVRLKGKRRPVRIFELRGLGSPSAEEAANLAEFEAALVAYEAEQWGESEVIFRGILAKWPQDGPTRRYLEELENRKGSLSVGEGNSRMEPHGR